MPDHIHTKKVYPAEKNAGDSSRNEQPPSEGRLVQDTREVSFFSLSGLCLILLRGYRRFISPCFPPCCRFTPSCSAYAMEAIMTHGACKGLALTFWRLLRCQPFCKGGYDPVPPPKKSSRKK